MIIMPEDRNIVSMLSPEDAKELLLALFSENGGAPELSPVANVVYTVIKSKSDRISSARSRAGKAGGAQNGNNNAAKQADHAETSKEMENDENEQNKQIKQSEAKQPTVTVSVTESVSVSEPDPLKHGALVRASEVAASEGRTKIGTRARGGFADLLLELEEPVREAFRDFVKMRVEIGKPLTDRAVKLSIGELRKFAGDDPEKQVAVINQSVLRSLQTFHPLDAYTHGGLSMFQPGRKRNTALDYPQHEYADGELKKMFEVI